MSGNRLLVCVSASATSADLVRRGMDLAQNLGVDWIVLHVQTTSSAALSEPNRMRATEHLRLAEALGARVEVVTGGEVVSTILEFALRNRVSRILIGKQAGSGLRGMIRKGVAAELVRKSGRIDVYVVQGGPHPGGSAESTRQSRRVLVPPVISLGAVTAATLLCGVFDRGSVATANIVMIYLLAAFSVSVLSGWVTGLMTSVLAVLAFNFFFTRPYYTLNVYDPQYLVTFAVMIVVTLGSGSLAARVRLQAELSAARERRTRTLYELSRKLSEANGEDRICEVARQELTGLLDGEVAVIPSARIAELSEPGSREAARWCVDNARSAGGGTDNFGDRGARFLPLPGREAVVGVIMLTAGQSVHRVLSDDPSLFAGITSLIAFALEREQASVNARERLVEVENEKMRNAVLRGISHDLRTPLAAIAGSATMLLRGKLDTESTQNLVSAIAQEAGWMSRVVENMLHATRLEAGSLQLDVNLEPIDDLVTSAVARVNRRTLAGAPDDGASPIQVILPDEVLVAPMDLALMEQVLINVLDNALRYSAAGAPITVTASTRGANVEIVVEDEGPGIRDSDRAQIFEKFFRGEASRSVRGAGLGLWISATVVAAHHGTIEAENRKTGGARFRITLPMAAQP